MWLGVVPLPPDVPLPGDTTKHNGQPLAEPGEGADEAKGSATPVGGSVSAAKCVLGVGVCRTVRVFLHGAAGQGTRPVSVFQSSSSQPSCRCRGVFAPRTRIPTLLIVFCVRVLLHVDGYEFRPK